MQFPHHLLKKRQKSNAKNVFQKNKKYVFSKKEQTLIKQGKLYIVSKYMYVFNFIKKKKN